MKEALNQLVEIITQGDSKVKSFKETNLVQTLLTSIRKLPAGNSPNGEYSSKTSPPPDGQNQKPISKTPSPSSTSSSTKGSENKNEKSLA